MNTFRNLLNKYPVPLFAVLAYALSWWSVPFAHGSLLPHGPFLAAILVVALSQGRTGVRDFFRRIVVSPKAWYWFLVGPALVIAYLLAALAINLLLGATITSTAHLQTIGPTALTLLLVGGLWEEPGWTGYLLPLLQARYQNRPRGLLLASLHTGLMRAIWHLPLVISGAIPWYDMVFFEFALQFLISWLYAGSGGSVLAVMLLHLTSNILGGATMVPLFTGDDRTQFYVLFIAMASLLAFILLLRSNWGASHQGRNPKAA
jgi:hypothetical protein